VVFLILVLLLRAVVAPLLLMLTVVLSFAASLGVCGLVFTYLFGFEGADSGFPLTIFIFTLRVRSLLVPALAYDLGARIWWPGRLAKGGHKESEPRIPESIG
jgi:uncharacterized membrane protein YdfJ with MMPL/SSD domain